MSYRHLTTFEQGPPQELLSAGHAHRVSPKLERKRACIDRKVFPKKPALAVVCQADLPPNLFRINSRPRKYPA